MESDLRVQQALHLLNENQNDQAIDLLRCDSAPNDARSCALLARAYFQRGDTKGDLFSAHFFAARALELGAESEYLHAVNALCCFQKERYTEANAAFENFITSDSNTQIKFIYASSLRAAGRDEESGRWMRAACDADHTLENLRALTAAFKEKQGAVEFPATGDMYASVIQSYKASEASQITAPYEYQPLSVHRGLAAAPKDFEWLAKNIPCQSACPAGTNIPEYLAAISAGEYDRAYEINLKDNVFPGVLGRVCARPCEDACRHGWDGLGGAVEICWSKRAAADHKTLPLVRLEQWFADSGRKVAVVGGGVAGLTAARDLALYGHRVTVFEKHSRMGGMMNQGIPEFRLPRNIIEAEVRQIEALGVELRCGAEAGRDFTLAELRGDFDAVILACGTLRPNRPELEGGDAGGIMHGLDFLLEVNEQGRTALDGDVVVIGGGFTAMDCARTAARIGAASVKVFYRRSPKEMLITKGELEELEFEGIPMEFMVSPKACLKDDQGRLRAVTFVRNELGERDADGRRRAVEIPGSEFEVAARWVLLATGQSAECAFIDPSLREALVDGSGYIKGGGSHQTELEGVFLAGDFSQGASSLISAIAHARATARQVDQFLTGEQRVQERVRVEDAVATGRIREMDDLPQTGMPMIARTERSLSREVETGFSTASATDEAQRCYLCHYKFEIDHDRCIYCDWCIKAKPRPNCILKVKALIKDAEGRTVDYQIAANTEETRFIYINQSDCIRCGACVNACPVGCISIQKVSKQTVLHHDLNKEEHKP